MTVRDRISPTQAAAAYDVVARREALPVNTPTSVLEACRSVVAATLFYGTDLYHYVRKIDGKYCGRIHIGQIEVTTPRVASAELAAALTTTALEAHDRRPFANSRTFQRVAPAQEYHKLAAAAGLEKPKCKGLNLGLSVHVERDLVIKVTVCVCLPTRLIVWRAGPVQGPRRVRRRRVWQEEAEQARAEGRARPVSVDHRIASLRTHHAPRSSRPRPKQRRSAY